MNIMTIYPGGKHCMREWPDLTGQRFGKLVVTGQAESSARGQRRWICKCDCGNECIVLGNNCGTKQCHFVRSLTYRP